MTDEQMENPCPSYYDALVKRQIIMERTLKLEPLPEPEVMSHAHVTVRSNMVWLTTWVKDPVTQVRRYRRIVLPYDHFLLIARGIADAHTEQESITEHMQVMRADD